MFEKDVFYHIFSWQCGHQRRINVSSYGLDAAFPGQIQSALLRLYRYISRLWHYWLGLLKRDEVLADRPRVIGEKRDLSTDEDERKEDRLPARKRRKVVDAETQMTPKKESALLDVGMDDTPVTKNLIEKMQEAERMMRLAREAIETRKRSRNLLNELGMST